MRLAFKVGGGIAALLGVESTLTHLFDGDQTVVEKGIFSLIHSPHAACTQLTTDAVAILQHMASESICYRYSRGMRSKCIAVWGFECMPTGETKRGLYSISRAAICAKKRRRSHNSTSL